MGKERPGDRRTGPPGRRGVPGVPARLRLQAARFLAPGGGMSLERFAQEVRREDRDIDLAQCCLLIAQDPYPALDVGRYMDEIERMALRLRAGIPEAMGLAERVEGW